MNPLLKQISALPTSPFCEEAVAGWIETVAKREGLKLSRDRHGNLLVQGRPGKPRWVFVAHMDHPGMEAAQGSAGGRLKATFRGGVLASHLKGVPVVFFDREGGERTGRGVRGVIISATAGERGMATKVVVKVKGSVAAGACGMFDLDVARQKGKLFHSRAIDDLGGVAAILQAVIQCKRQRGGPGVAALLTRGEEDGFVGAIAAAKEGTLLKKTDYVVSIECSAMQPYAPQGKGVVIRVGDKTSVFDSGMTYQMVQAAEELAKKSKGFAFQRALMPGGTCEATAFGVYGYRAAAVCIPLGNYHNMVPGKKQIAAEYIHLGDWECLVNLLTALGRKKPEDATQMLRERLDKRFARLGKLLSR